jgi:hypothetical protein
MLDPNKLKVGSVVRFEVTVQELFEGGGSSHRVQYKGFSDTSELIYNELFHHAELLSTPVEFSDEQIEAINLFQSKDLSPISLREWLEAHREKK